MEKLKPCPFCGGKVYLSYTSVTQTFNFTHSDITSCPFPVFMTDFEDYDISNFLEAAKAWNRRSDNA